MIKIALISSLNIIKRRRLQGQALSWLIFIRSLIAWFFKLAIFYNLHQKAGKFYKGMLKKS